MEALPPVAGEQRLRFFWLSYRISAGERAVVNKEDRKLYQVEK
jgi:hypothetical protein